MSSKDKDIDKDNVSIWSSDVDITGDDITSHDDALARTRDVTTPGHGGALLQLASRVVNTRGSSHIRGAHSKI